MKKLSSLIIFLFLTTGLFSQKKNDIEQTFKDVNFGIGGGYGIINPKDLNNFLENTFNNVTFTGGFPEIILYLNLYIV